MSQKRRKFSPQFKAEAVQFVIETGRPINEIAEELEIHEARWVIGSSNGKTRIRSRKRL